MTKKPMTYRDAGVDIDAGNNFVKKIKPLIEKTLRSEVISDIGGFGGLFELSKNKYKKPILVSGTDGVGTKLILAQQLNDHSTIGIDLVAMCSNDVLVQGAEPLFFLDYFACGKLDIKTAAIVVKGISDGCLQAGIALIGGETAEMPDMYNGDDYDLAGFCVGVVDKENLIDGNSISTGDIIVGLSSSGPHSNGFSLIRKILEIGDKPIINGQPIEKLLLSPTRIYVKPIIQLIKKVKIKGLAHITGGGITENIPRILKNTIQAEININSWNQGPVFDWLSIAGKISPDEMRKTFNCGVGMVVIVEQSDLNSTLDILNKTGEVAWKLGEITSGKGKVKYV
ncbi:MAG: phosphoribosylformylglycinamidine cyclo-ligase [Gammaproteobacteria bacterium]|nr:phosphoribosylformylglycinamidine cyclo-ligase [Gammaproteobacteria bacterium]